MSDQAAQATVPKISQKPDSANGQGKAQRGLLRLVENAPIPENRTVTPRRRPASEMRDRKHLTPSEVEALYQAAKRHGRYGQRDALAIWMMYRHGLRVGELCGLRWTAHVDFSTGTLRVERLKNGVASVQPIDERTIRGLRRLQKASEGRYVFINERGQPMTDMGIRKMLRRVAATVPGLAELAVHPHALRHSCGFALANKGMDTRSLQHYLGHRHTEHTVIYTEMAANRFERVWD
jgi:site-specific recombinase XerD